MQSLPGAEYSVNISTVWKNGVSTPTELIAVSDWKFDKMSITAYCDSECWCSLVPPKCEWTMDDPFTI